MCVWVDLEKKMHQIISAVLYICVGGLTPGPNNLLLMSGSLNFGLKKTLPHFLGVCVGFPVSTNASAENPRNARLRVLKVSSAKLSESFRIFFRPI